MGKNESIARHSRYFPRNMSVPIASLCYMYSTRYLPQDVPTQIETSQNSISAIIAPAIMPPAMANISFLPPPNPCLAGRTCFLLSLPIVAL